jgi:hypothetical protein
MPGGGTQRGDPFAIACTNVHFPDRFAVTARTACAGVKRNQGLP